MLFVTGTSTDVGKTVVTAALAALGLQRGSVAVVKPGQTGVADDEPGDLAEVGRLAGPVACHELVRYPDPLSPAAAARARARRRALAWRTTSAGARRADPAAPRPG